MSIDVPVLRYPPELPITARKDEVVGAIRDHQVVVVAGETGSGKSTQLPKMCLEAGRGTTGLIGHTQPRRLAARTLAERIAEEVGTTLGGLVGYTVRFTDEVGDRTVVKLMTDGILLAEIHRDPELRRYDTVIVDEAHERSLNIDFLLGYLRRLLPRRPDLKVIVTSATIDTARFAAHFADAAGTPAPIIEVSGRTYPVEVRYRPRRDEDGVDRDPPEAIVDAVHELSTEGPGDILVFLSGEREIRDTADALRHAGLPKGTEVLPLFARLAAADQHRIFQPHRGRRIVLATNIAETSLTVPGVRYVVDTGTARISRYSRRTKVQRLPIEPVSRASADQRAGRCGRVAPGICIRLYSEDDHLSRPEYGEPEILRTNLASVILQMTALGLGDVAGFPFIDPPDARNVKDGITLLEELGALEPALPAPRRRRRRDATTASGHRLTPVGRRLAHLPLDPRLGRMVLEAERLGCLREVRIIAAALSIQDPRERPADRQQAAAELHGRFADPSSDFVAFLNLWDHVHERQRALSSNQFRKLCRAELLHYLRVREWQDIHRQLREITRGLGMRADPAPADHDRIHRAVLAGLLSHVGMRDAQGREYEGARGARFALSPGSALSTHPPRWVMAAELVETTRLWAHVAARIQPEWVERAAAHLVRRTYTDPEWDRARGEAVAVERVTLYGLPLVTGRRVSYARIDAAGARAVFVRCALVECDWDAPHAFLAENRRRVAQVLAFEARARRRDLLAPEDAQIAFFDERMPEGVTTGRRFDRWWKEERHRHPDLLTLPYEVLVDRDAGPVDLAAYPDTWRDGDVDLPLSYEFDPTSPTDGVTVHVPLPVLGGVRAAGFEWNVPGLRAELVAGLIRSLPKDLRRWFVPAPDCAREFLATAGGDGPGGGRLLDALARFLATRAGTGVSPEDFDLDRLAPHLRMTFRVEDERGRALAVGKDLDHLRAAVGGHVRAAAAGAGSALERGGLRAWEVGALPRTVDAPWGEHSVTGYPALVDEGDSVALRVLPTPDEQAAAMRAGVRRLLLIAVPSATRGAARALTSTAGLALAAAPHPSTDDLAEDCAACAADVVIAEAGGPPWDEAGFRALRDRARAALPARVAEVVALVAQILQATHELDVRLGALRAPAFRGAVDDISRQLARLVSPGFVARSGLDRLRHFPRYLAAIDRRLDRLAAQPGRDAELTASVRRLEDALDAELDRLPPGTPAPHLARARWLIEELRVSYFAQSLGTAEKVSEKRVLRELAG